MANHKLPHYPADHPVGAIVPEGGSSCAKCEYVNGQDCRNKSFVFWNGGKKIPGPINSYCCDFFETAPDIRDKKFEDAGL
jgi:hypothetical protein